MYSKQASRGFAIGIVRAFDPGTIDGAKNLYTIAPEPGTLGLLVVGGLLMRRPRRGSARRVSAR